MAKQPKTSTIKFLKLDCYGNSTWSSTAEIDKTSYDTLLELTAAVSGMFPYAFNPLYANAQFKSISVRFDKQDAFKFKKDMVYKVQWLPKARVKQSTGEKYVILKITSKPVFVRVEIVEEEDLDL
jgi:hypothetical protein